MRKLTALGLAVCMGVTALTGCGSSSSATVVTEAAAVTKAAAETGGGGETDVTESERAEGSAESAQSSDSQSDSSESGLERLVLTYVTSPLNVPTIIEKNKGMFGERFSDMGISVEYAEINSGADQTQALASGDVQILYGVGATSVILSAANGADIKVLNMYSRSPKAFCMYSKDDSLTTPASLKGKTIAGPAGTNLHELLAAYLAEGGLRVEDVNYVNMSIADAKAALDGNSVDVALIAGATAYQANEQGYHMVADGEGRIKAIIAVAAREDFCNENSDVINRFMQIQKEIISFIQDNEEEALKIVAQELDLDEAAVKEMYTYYDFSLDISDEDREGFQKTADFMLESEMIEEPLDVNTLF